MAYLFEISGVRLSVQTNPEMIESFGVPCWIPTAAVDCPIKHHIEDCDGVVFTSQAFAELPEYLRTYALAHEAGHVALGHLKLEECSTDEIIENEVLEAQADAWAAKLVGEDNYDHLIDEMTNATLKAITDNGGTLDLTGIHRIKMNAETRKLMYKMIGQ